MEIFIPYIGLTILSIKTIVALIIMFIVIKIIQKKTDILNDREWKYAKWFSTIVVIWVLFVMPIIGGSLSPKLHYVQPPNNKQIEYNAPKDVTITTPEPRTKELDGFTTDKRF